MTNIDSPLALKEPAGILHYILYTTLLCTLCRYVLIILQQRNYQHLFFFIFFCSCPFDLSVLTLTNCIYLCIFIHTYVCTAVPPSNTTILPRTTTNPAMRGEDFQLECSAEGNRAPNYTWSYNGRMNLTELSMTPDSRFTVDAPRGGLLTVRMATYGDAGRYTCIASNEVGTDSASINVEIQGK